jgi:hypothetical protein
MVQLHLPKWKRNGNCHKLQGFARASMPARSREDSIGQTVYMRSYSQGRFPRQYDMSASSPIVSGSYY